MKSLAAAKLVNWLSGGRMKYGWWSAPWTSEERPILIGGCARSGTTLLKELLNAHPRVSIGPETAIFNSFPNVEQLARISGLSIERVRQICRRSHALGDFFERFNKALMEDAGKDHWGEKTPTNVRYLHSIFRAFPRARFIHAVRDGRDVVCSLRTHPKYERVDGVRIEKGTTNSWESCLERWVGDVASGLEFRGDPRYCEIEYESLVGSPEPTLRTLLSWLGLEWDADILERYKTDRHLQQPRLSDPINQDRLGRWRRELPVDGRSVFRGKANALLITLGYACDDSWIEESV